MPRTHWLLLFVLLVGGCASMGSTGITGPLPEYGHGTSGEPRVFLSAQPDGALGKAERAGRSVTRALQKLNTGGDPAEGEVTSKRDIVLEALNERKKDSNLWKAERMKMDKVVVLELVLAPKLSVRLMGEVPLCEEKCIRIELAKLLELAGIL